MKKVTLITLLIPMLMTACKPSLDEVAEAISIGLTQTQAAQPSLTFTITPSFTPTLTSTLTSTLTPTLTSTLTPTFTFTPSITASHTIAPSQTFSPTPPSSVQIKPNTPIRSGPGNSFPVISKPATQVELALMGKSSNGDWIIVELTNGNAGWIDSEFVDIPGSIQGLAIMTPPSPPSKITITLVNNTNKYYRVEGPFGNQYMGSWSKSVTVFPGSYSFQVCNDRVDHNKKCGNVITLMFSKDTTINITQLDLP